jgi:pimeloyl-ACP methyl ester carboxylesterase
MTGATAAIGPPESDRVNFAYSANRRYAACLATSQGRPRLERWTLTGEEPACAPVRDLDVDGHAFGLPLDDGSLLVLRSAGTGSHELLWVHDPAPDGPAPDGPARDGSAPDGSAPRRARCDVTRLGELPGLPGAYLLPGPRGGCLGFAVVFESTLHTSIWQASGAEQRLKFRARVPGYCTGGVWLSDDVLACDQRTTADGASGIAVDLSSGQWRRIFAVSEASTDRVVGYAPAENRLFLSTNASGGQRLGWGPLGGVISFPEVLRRPGITAAALEHRGERLLVREAMGAVSRLSVYDPPTGRLTEMASLPGIVTGAACWSGSVIRFPFSAPGQPPTLASLALHRSRPATTGFQVTGEIGVGRTGGPAAELVTVAGPAGPIEAIAYGGPAWRTNPQLVLALHGGPVSAWRFEFDPLRDGLAAAGIAVLAPNQRGSAGYGERYLRATIGDWGGPDLDDLCHLARELTEQRRQRGLDAPILLGGSYGAFLALLAACRQPGCTSGVIALAPFLSGRDLHADGSIGVRRRIAELGGLRGTGADAGARDPGSGDHGAAHRPGRDVLAACPDLSAPLLLVHGRADDVIPVEHSRRLAARLAELGRIEGLDFDYLEVDGTHAEVASAKAEPLRRTVLRFCRTRQRPAPTPGAGRKPPSGVGERKARLHQGAAT